MKQVVLDDSLRARIGDLTEDVAVCSESGETIGVVVPKSLFYRMLMQMPEARVSREELEQSFAEQGGRTLKEIKQRLGMG